MGVVLGFDRRGAVGIAVCVGFRVSFTVSGGFVAPTVMGFRARVAFFCRLDFVVVRVRAPLAEVQPGRQSHDPHSDKPGRNAGLASEDPFQLLFQRSTVHLKCLIGPRGEKLNEILGNVPRPRIAQAPSTPSRSVLYER